MTFSRPEANSAKLHLVDHLSHKIAYNVFLAISSRLLPISLYEQAYTLRCCTAVSISHQPKFCVAQFWSLPRAFVKNPNALQYSRYTLVNSLQKTKKKHIPKLKYFYVMNLLKYLLDTRATYTRYNRKTKLQILLKKSSFTSLTFRLHAFSLILLRLPGCDSDTLDSSILLFCIS